MKRFLRRHRWNLLCVVGLVLALWVGPYGYLKHRNSFHFHGHRYIWVSPGFPDELILLFQPLVIFDAWITGETVQLVQWDFGYVF
ncbi:MAG: hypothetical protein KDM63_21605 [Verrucomicrobiae bacterium]|nr:hypothetical protein [Verrucomicrobiae bacterium]